MTRDDILTEVYNSQVLNKMANKYISRLKGNTDDFISHCLLILCEMDEAKLVKLYNDKQLYFYIIRVCTNQAVNQSSTFNNSLGRLDTCPLFENTDFNAEDNQD